MTLDFFSAFIIGLLGSGHCIAMCGGITTMLTSALPPSAKFDGQEIPVNTLYTSQTYKKATLVLFYNLGRIGSYTLIGAIVGFTGSIAAKNIGMPLTGLRMFSAIFMILLGLYIGQWLMLLNRVEALGKVLWRYISPFATTAIPVTSPYKALLLGSIWGWLPCGLVYSTLTWALASGSFVTGAGIMTAFGLGTLPALLTLSIGFNSIKKQLVNPLVKKIMAIMLISYGIYSFNVAYQQMF